MTSSPTLPTNAPPSPWTPRTCCSSSTPAARRESRRASCTPPAGYLVGVSTTHRYVFDIKEDDVYWCTADIGWVTGHSYIVYGPLANGTTTLMYEGTPDFPDRGRFWDLDRQIRRQHFLHRADRDSHVHALGQGIAGEVQTFVAAADRHRRRADQSRGLDLVQRKHRPRALPHRGYLVADRNRLHHDFSAARASPRRSPARPRARFPASSPKWWISTASRSVRAAAATWCSSKPWPSMLRTIYGDPDRYVQNYWSRYPGKYFTGDGCKLDEDGYFWLLGRVDDVMNVSGHRISTYEVESALVDHHSVAEAAVIGKTHEIKGQGISAFVTLKEGIQPSDKLKEELKKHVVHENRRDRPARRYFLHRRTAQDAQRQNHAPPAARYRRRPRPRATPPRSPIPPSSPNSKSRTRTKGRTAPHLDCSRVLDSARLNKGEFVARLFRGEGLLSDQPEIPRLKTRATAAGHS